MNLSQQRRATVSWAARGGALPAAEEEDRHWRGHPLSAVSSAGLTRAGKSGADWRESSKSPPNWGRDRSISPVREVLREMGLISLEKRRLRESPPYK